MSLYGIETKDDCRKKVDELLELHRRAKETMTKEAMEALKSRLEELYKKYKGRHANRAQLSEVENAWFWPVIEKAYAAAPKLSSPKTWPRGLYLIALSLNDYRDSKYSVDVACAVRSDGHPTGANFVRESLAKRSGGALR